LAEPGNLAPTIGNRLFHIYLPLNREDEEERTMNRNHFPTRRLVLPVLLIALVTALLPQVVAYAEAPTPVSGARVRVGPFRNVTTREAGGNTIITREATQTWTGDISGTAEVQQTLVQHPNGEFTSQSIATCTCTVDGVTGILYVRSQGHSDPNAQIFLGTWTIVGGEGDLAGLRGQGTVTQVPPAPNLYEGTVHFHP
jgi:hypothetical protein